MWRVGHVCGPLDFTPLQFCSWANRFDYPPPHPPDPPAYRTLYCAEHRATCLREVFDPLYPSLKTARDMASALSCTLEEALSQAGEVTPEPIVTSALAPARIELLSGHLEDLRDVKLRRQLEKEHAELLLANGAERLDTSVTRGPVRVVTQVIGRSLYERGAAGVIYGSKIDDLPCIALFEGRSRLVPDGDEEPLAGLLDELKPIFDDLGLRLNA